MASKSASDNSVAERRLRPIYDWLDSGNNKRALQESDKVLKKQPHMQCARILKSLALLRLGKETECEELLESVRKEIPCDDPSLQAMSICYREMNKLDTICEMYEAATKADPTNEELLTHLFMSYVRVGNYKKQQSSSMALYKLKPKNPYYFWAIMSVVMQACKGDTTIAKSITLPLAQRMVERFVQKDKIEAEQEVQLYIMILEMQDKFEEALAVVKGPLGEKLQSYYTVPTRAIELLMKMGRWKEANIAIKELLLKDIDNWSLYKNYFESVFNMAAHVKEFVSENIVDDDGKADCTFEACVKFISKLQNENEKLTHTLRGPYLAFLELYLKLFSIGKNAKEYLGPLPTLLINYFYHFGAKSCCLSDLRPYLNILSKSEVTSFLDYMWKLLQLEDGQLPTSKEQMLRYISNLHISRYLGFHEELSCESKLHLTSCLMRYYQHAAQFNDPNALCTEIMHNDPFALLVAHMLHDVWLETNQTSYLRDALIVLEYALRRSPSNHQIKLLLLKLYNSLGLSKAAHIIYEMLDIKHMQLDSLGYLQCWPLLYHGQYTIASQLFDTTLKFFTSNYKDSTDHLTFSYKYGSFLKISEFVDFREKLGHSLHFALITVEKMLLEIYNSTSIQHTLQVIDQMDIINSKDDDVYWNNLKDNRDFDVYWTADPLHRRIDQEMIQRSYLQDIDLLRLRRIFLRLITKTAGLWQINSKLYCRNGIKHFDSDLKILIEMVEQLKSIISRFNEKPYSKIPRNIIGAPSSSRLFMIMESPLPDFLIHASEILIDILSFDNISDYSNNYTTVQLQRIEKLEHKIEQIFNDLALRVKNGNIAESSYSQVLIDLTLHLELICIATTTCTTIYKVANLGNNVVRKPKKKTDDANPKKKEENEKCKVERSKRLASLVISENEKFQTLLNSIELRWKSINDIQNTTCSLLKEVEINNDLLSSITSDIENRFVDSFAASFTDMTSILKGKCKYLNEHIL